MDVNEDAAIERVLVNELGEIRNVNHKNQSKRREAEHGVDK